MMKTIVSIMLIIMAVIALVACFIGQVMDSWMVILIRLAPLFIAILFASFISPKVITKILHYILMAYVGIIMLKVILIFTGTAVHEMGVLGRMIRFLVFNAYFDMMVEFILFLIIAILDGKRKNWMAILGAVGAGYYVVLNILSHILSQGTLPPLVITPYMSTLWAVGAMIYGIQSLARGKRTV